MTTQALTVKQQQQLTALSNYSPEEIELLRQTLAKDCNDLELALYVATCRSRKLDPFARQIYAVKYGGKIVFQTGIDGFRAIAGRDPRYAGSDEPEFGPMVHSDGIDHPEYAVVTVHKMVSGQRVPFVGKAYWDEFARKYQNKLGDMWASMPRNQLAKCAEGQALRKGFPELMEGITYVEDSPAEPVLDANALIIESERLTAPRREAEAAPARATTGATTPLIDPDYDDLPDSLKSALLICPQHGIEWRHGSSGSQEWWNHQDQTGEKVKATRGPNKGKLVFPNCYRNKALTAMLEAVAVNTGMSAEALALAVHERFKASLSDLTDIQRCQMIATLRGDDELVTTGDIKDDNEPEDLPEPIGSDDSLGEAQQPSMLPQN